MASNPMQRKTRNAFMLGMIIALLIGAAVAGLIFMQLNKQIKEKDAKIKSFQVEQVYVLTRDVNSGDILTEDMFTTVNAMKTAIPSDYANITKVLKARSLYTKNGDPIRSEYKVDENNVEQQHLYLKINNKDVELFLDENTGNLYYGNNNDKTIVETTEAPVIIKISAKSNTIISPSMIARSNEIDTDDVRKQEYNVLVLPMDLQSNDYVDIRLSLPNGQDYIVLSKKRVDIPQIGSETLADTIQMKMSEDELLTMSCAIVEASNISDAKLYAIKYVEPGLQNAASPTYLVNKDVANLIDRDPNVVNEAKKALYQRYSSNLSELRENYINKALTENADGSGYSGKLQESITSTKDARQKYIQSITSGTTTDY